MASTSSTTMKDYQELPTLHTMIVTLTMNFAKLKFTSVLQTNLVAQALVKMTNVVTVRIQKGIVQAVLGDTRVIHANQNVTTECLETCVKTSVDIV